MNRIRTSMLTRGFSLFKASVKVGALSASSWLNPSGEKPPGWLNQLDFLIKEIGQLKGTAMKVGQTLSIYGEHLLPKEANELIKQLQQNSPSLSWEAIYEVLLEELGAERLKLLNIDQKPIAAASIGQVYKAQVKSRKSARMVLKVQYPGIGEAVETDLKLLKFILNMTEVLPRGPRFEQIFAEIREMFYQEIDYTLEREFSERFGLLLQHDPRYRVPHVHPDFCTAKILGLDFMQGLRADHPDVQTLTQERRNELGKNFLQLYLMELLDFQLMQTDPHLGNYLIAIDPKGSADQLILLDFGAVRQVPNEFLLKYIDIIEGGLTGDARRTEKGGRQLGLLLPDDSLSLVNEFTSLVFAILEPFQGVYDWGASDLPKRIAGQLSRIAFNYRMRAPPRELVFLDRKLAGVFIFLSVLNCKMDARHLILEAIQKFHARAKLAPN